MSITVREIRPEDGRSWDAFVHGHARGTPFHLLAWKNSIERTFGYKPIYLAAFEDSSLCGVLPLFLVNGFMTGKALISSPFAVYGGILSASATARDAIRDHTQALAERFEVQYVELRNAHPDQCVGWAAVERYVTFTRLLKTQEPDALLADIPKKTRNMVRKALKTGFRVEKTRDWRRFEALHSLTLRRLGTPSFPPRHFAELVANFGPMVEIHEVHLDGKTVAASMTFVFHADMHIYYAATDPAYNALAPNYRMYFEHLLCGGKRGFSTFDFGRSKLNTGTFEFKRHWGAEMRPLPYEILLVRRRELPNLSPVNPKFQLALAVWRRLPLAFTRRLGPYLIRLFP